MREPTTCPVLRAIEAMDPVAAAAVARTRESISRRPWTPEEVRQHALEVLDSIDFERVGHGAGDRSGERADEHPNPGTMTAFPTTPDEDLF